MKFLIFFTSTIVFANTEFNLECLKKSYLQYIDLEVENQKHWYSIAKENAKDSLVIKNYADIQISHLKMKKETFLEAYKNMPEKINFSQSLFMWPTQFVKLDCEKSNTPKKCPYQWNRDIFGPLDKKTKAQASIDNLNVLWMAAQDYQLLSKNGYYKKFMDRKLFKEVTAFSNKTEKEFGCKKLNP